MPPPFCLKESCEKKNVKNNNNKTFHSVTNRVSKFYDADPMVSDILGELQTVMVENAKLQSANKNLKMTANDLQYKYNDLLESIQTNKLNFEVDLNKLQDEIRQNEVQLLENSKMCLQQQKRHVQEINILKAENEKLQLEIAKNETTFMEQIKNLEGEAKLLQLNYDNTKNLNDENAQKAAKYKSKLKYAITIINDLNNMLLQYAGKPETNHQETQTEDRQQCTFIMPPANPYVTESSVPVQPKLETDDLLLSEVFFKSKAFCDEVFLFNDKESERHGVQRTKLDL